MKILEKIKKSVNKKSIASISPSEVYDIPAKFYKVKNGKVIFYNFDLLEAHEFIAIGNHLAIMQAIKTKCFSIGNPLYVFQEILNRGNHDEIMAFLDYGNRLQLDFDTCNKLIWRNNHDEIMLALKNKVFEGDYIIYGFNELVQRGNHQEIMAFLSLFKNYALEEDEAQRLIERGNHDEIMLAITNENFCRFGYVWSAKEIILRGNHEEIMGILKLTKIDSEIVDLLLRRGNVEEIKYVSK